MIELPALLLRGRYTPASSLRGAKRRRNPSILVISIVIGDKLIIGWSQLCANLSVLLPRPSIVLKWIATSNLPTLTLRKVLSPRNDGLGSYHSNFLSQPQSIDSQFQKYHYQYDYGHHCNVVEFVSMY